MYSDMFWKAKVWMISLTALESQEHSSRRCVSVSDVSHSND